MQTVFIVTDNWTWQDNDGDKNKNKKNKNKNKFISEQNEMRQQWFSIDNYTPGNPYYGCYR